MHGAAAAAAAANARRRARPSIKLTADRSPRLGQTLQRSRVRGHVAFAVPSPLFMRHRAAFRKHLVPILCLFVSICTLQLHSGDVGLPPPRQRMAPPIDDRNPVGAADPSAGRVITTTKASTTCSTIANTPEVAQETGVLRASSQPPEVAQETGVLPASSPPQRPRLHWMDYLRCFLTLLVVCHHCVCTYAGNIDMWDLQVGTRDLPLQFASAVFVSSNQAYFMGLFFLLAGFCTPGSCRRKGAWRFLLDRTLRLLVPCVIYSVTLPPLLYWLNISTPGALPRGSPPASTSLADVFRQYFTHDFNIAAGPPWFIYMLWWFSVAYAALAAICSSRAVCAAAARLRQSARGAAAGCLPRTTPDAAAASTTATTGGTTTTGTPLTPDKKQQHQQPLPGRRVAAGLIVGLTAVTYAVRVLMAVCFHVFPFTFWRPLPVVIFMPDMLPQYLAAFVLGVLAHATNGLTRLPGLPVGLACLAAGGVFWIEAYVVVFFGMPDLLQSPAAAVRWAAWALHTFMEQSFAVVWSLGLLVVFQHLFNARPGRVWRVVARSAYTVYLIHPLYVTLYGRVLLPLHFPTLLVNALVLCPMVVLTSWLAAAGITAMPGVRHVL